MTLSPEADSAQHQISELLQAELLHTLGSYRFAGAKLETLRKSLGAEEDKDSDAKRVKGPGTKRAEAVLYDIANAALVCNDHLCDRLHRAAPVDGALEGGRHPSPYESDEDAVLDNDLLKRIAHFYETAATALGVYMNAKGKKRAGAEGDGREESPGVRLGRIVAVIHDPQRRSALSEEEDSLLLRGRLDRMMWRLEQVNELLGSARPRSLLKELPADIEHASAFSEILRDHVDIRIKQGALHLTVLEALSEAHMCMHQAEHLRSQSFGAMFTTIPETNRAMEVLLRRSVVLNTFAYVVGRSMPWIFAESAEERDYVLDNYDRCCTTLTPTYCMWISHQLSLLALHRRAYTWWTLGKRDRAYRDFYKLTRLLRDLRQRIKRRAVRVPGTKTFIEGLMGIAEHHIGRIYRGQHAHRVAVRYFERASLHLKGWEDHHEIGHLLRNSRWRLSLLISQGKANYELGKVKKSLLFYARAWRAFLLLAESESHSTANLDVAENLISWLASIEDDPEMSKTELTRRLEPLVEQFESVYSPESLRLLAADIMMRMGHLLFILKLPPEDFTETDEPGELPPKPDHKLANRCMCQAIALDPTNTLILADLLKIRRASEDEDSNDRRSRVAPPELGNQWPSGGGRFEAAARIIEYVLQRWLDSPPAGAASGDSRTARARRTMARELLGSFLAHTDSSNVKLAQVYRYLMQESRGLAWETEAVSPTIDLVCLRRYSSFFPFLPRPSAFHAPGGGYLVQVCEPGESTKPFGIAIDPGPDYLINLYRCGYALSDIHMIVLTHDHADHIASLDALLTLMGIRMMLGDPTFDDSKRLLIIGNESVVKRYRFFNTRHPIKRDAKGKKLKRGDTVKVLSFEAFDELSRMRGNEREQQRKKKKILLDPRTLRIEPVCSLDHHDSAGHVSQGFVLSVGAGKDRSSILFTSDTGSPLSLADGKPHYPACGGKSLKSAAASADVVVAHLSSVPMRELRELAELSPGDADPLAEEFKQLWQEALEQTKGGSAGGAGARRDTGATAGKSGKEAQAIERGAEATKFLLQQLQFAFRTRADPKMLKESGAHELSVSPLSPLDDIKEQSEKHLYLTGLLDLAEHMADKTPEDRAPLLLIGELREELGTFRTRIASHVTARVFERGRKGARRGKRPPPGMALTADIGLRLRLARPAPDRSQGAKVALGHERRALGTAVLCTTCDLDNDLVATERFHSPRQIREVCVKGENEGVFYNCVLHDPGMQRQQPWVESVERFDVFGD
jgi:tetratricopeptide (TPR) repeat protein